MKWILIILMFGSGKAAHHIEFDNMEGCEYAATKIEARSSGWQTYVICVPKRLP